MAYKKELKFNSKQSSIIIVIVFGLLVFRFFSIGEVKDSSLEQAVRSELQNELASVTAENQYLLDEGKTEDYIKAVDLSNIKIKSMSVSKPLLLLGSSVEAVVKVEYVLPETTRPRTIYYKFNHSLIGGWTQGIETTSFFYYSNFF